MSHKGFTQFSILVLFVIAFMGTPLHAQAGGVCGGTYVVEKGETIESIAATCGTSVAAIRAANPGIGGSLTAGQVITVPGSNYVIPTTPVPIPPIPVTDTPIPNTNNYNYYTNNYYNYYSYSPAGYKNTYIVQYGDTFSAIAHRFGVGIYDLWNANPNIANINYLYPGQVIYVPAMQAGYPPVYPGTVIMPTDTPSSLFYSEAPDGSPKGKIKFITKTNADIYISLQGTTSDGYTVINEYSISGSTSVKITAGFYTYVALVGDQKFYGQVNLNPNGNRSITFYKDKVVVGE